jgi:hypothetical protein
MIRIPTAAVTASALVLALATIGLHAQDLSRYRDFQLGSTVAAVLKASGATAADVKSMQQRPARIQELRWRPSERYNDRMMATESVHEVMFSFYNDQLFRMVIDYDRQRTEGLTDADLIDSISARYGVSILQAASLPTAVPPRHASPDGDAVIARWSDADTSLTLVRGTYPTTLRLVIASKSTEALASNASAEAARLDRIEAPQREVDRVNKMTEDHRVAAEKARAINKPLFKP